MELENSKSLGIVLDGNTYKTLKIKAHNEWRPMSQQIRYAIHAGLEKTDIEKLKDKVGQIHDRQEQLFAMVKEIKNSLQK